MKYLLICCAGIITAGIGLIFQFQAKSGQGKSSLEIAGKGFVIIELFTSEGCSSCPAADAVVENMQKKFPGNVFVLGFHVDYWNRLGWKDAFSDAKYSRRQRDYAASFSLSSVYTPQVVINGTKQFVGSDAVRIKNTVIEEIQHSAKAPIDVKLLSVSDRTVLVHYDLQAAENTVMNIALVQNTATTYVGRGENQGRNLNHINIVRDFKTIGLYAGKTGTAALTIPTSLQATACKVVAFIQEENHGKITSVSTFVLQ